MKYIRAAVRYFLFVVMTLGIYSVWYVGAFFIPNEVFWRQLIFRNWGRAFALIAKMRIEIVGALPRPPFFLVSNHLSYVDIPAFSAVVDCIFVAKREIESWFLAGTIVRNMGNIYIDRKNRRDIPRAGAKIIDALGRGEGVMLFPEGVSTIGARVLPFNSSFLEFAAKTDLPVSYASITYRTPDGEPPPSASVCWWDETTFAAHLWKLFQLKQFTVIINFGDKKIMNHDRKILSNQLHQKVSRIHVPAD